MTVLLVILTSLVIIAITYNFRGRRMAVRQQPLWSSRAAAPHFVRASGFNIPESYCFHPGHTWVLDEGGQNARVGLDQFAANIVGAIGRIEVPGLNRWVRQGEKVLSITCAGTTIEMLSPVEGVVIAVNAQVEKDPSIIAKDPYNSGWVCMIKAPELALNIRNLLRGSYIGPWMQNAVRRISELLPNMNAAMAQDGGLPVAGLLTQVDSEAQRAMLKEFFLAGNARTEVRRMKS